MAFQNFFAAKLYTDIGAGDTTIILDTAPTATSGRMVLEARNPTQREIIKYTGVSGNQLTGVTRGVGGTTAKSHLKNALIEQNLTAEDIQDIYDAFASFSASNTNWFQAVTTVTNVVNNGNRSYTITTNSDLTNILSPGMRLRTTRTVAAPTQCSSLNGTNQYWVKTSPNKLSFTDDFVVSVWVKITSYANGGIVSRFNGSSGWVLQLDGNGRPMLGGYNGGAVNSCVVVSLTALPLNRWVHVAAQLDMSAGTSSATTCYVMIDGVDVPVTVTRSGTNPTSLVQAGNLEIGSWNASMFFPGKIAQVAIFNAKVAQATMRSYISQGLSGSETSLDCAYSFNGVATDLNATTPNDLTAMNSATATNADSPFGGQANGTISSTLDYGIVQSVSFSTSTTLVVQVAEGCTIPTIGGLTLLSYSSARAPYLFPAQANKWRLEVIVGKALGSPGSSSGTTYTFGTAGTGGFNLNVPIGAWKLGTQSTIQIVPNAAGIDVFFGISPSSSAFDASGNAFASRVIINQAAGSAAHFILFKLEDVVTLSTATPYYALVRSGPGMSVAPQLRGGFTTVTPEASKIYAENAYL